MAFLPKFADREGYTDANIYEFERKRDRPRIPTSSVSWEPSPLQQGFGSRGMLDQVGRRSSPASATSGNPTAGLLGIQNTTGFAQEAPNVVYDQGPEQFEKQLKLQKEGLGIERLKAEGILEQNRALNEARMQNADANTLRAQVADYKARNPNSLIREMADGVYAIDPQTNQVIKLGGGLAGQKFGYDWALGDQRNQGQMDVQGLRNTGAMNVQGLRNTGAMDTTAARNAAMLEAVGLRNASAETLEGLRQSGALDRLLQSLGAQQNNAIFREGSNTYRTQLREGLINPEDPIEGRPPQYPRGDINLPSQNKPAFNSLPGGTVGGVLPGAAPPVNPNTTPETLQLTPGQMQGFGAKPGQYTAKPGQYTPGAQQPQQGAAGTPQSDAQLEEAAVTELQAAGQKVTPANIQYMMQQIKAKGGIQGSTATPGAPAAGALSGIGAGQLTGRSAGSVR
jgi:hypothetical protein